MGFRFIRQHDSMQCGVACLAMICRSYGPDYSLKYLSSVCTPTSEGLSLLALKKCAERLGFDVLCGAFQSVLRSRWNSIAPSSRIENLPTTDRPDVNIHY